MIAASAVARRGFGLALVAVLITSGCAAGRDSQTSNQIATQDGTNANAGTMALRGLSLVGPTATSYAPGSAIKMRLVLVNNGIHDDRLTNIVTTVARGWASYRNASQARLAISEQNSSTTPGSAGPSASSTPGTSASATASAPSSPGSQSSSPTTVAPSTPANVPQPETAVVIPAGQRVSWGVPDSKRVLVLLSSVGKVYPGTTVKITFTFARAGSVSVEVPVQLSTEPADSASSVASDG